MNKVNKNNIIFYSLIFGIMIVGIVCVTFIIKNSFITSESICNNLQGHVIYLENKKYTLEDKESFNFKIEAIEDIEQDRLKEVKGILIIKKDDMNYEIPMKISYIKEDHRWNMLNINYDIKRE